MEEYMSVPLPKGYGLKIYGFFRSLNEIEGEHLSIMYILRRVTTGQAAMFICSPLGYKTIVCIGNSNDELTLYINVNQYGFGPVPLDINLERKRKVFLFALETLLDIVENGFGSQFVNNINIEDYLYEWV